MGGELQGAGRKLSQQVIQRPFDDLGKPLAIVARKRALEAVVPQRIAQDERAVVEVDLSLADRPGGAFAGIEDTDLERR